MKFDKYIVEDQLNEQFLDNAFLKMKEYGAKMGVKVERTKSIAEMLMDGGRELQRFVSILFHYSTHADVLDTAERKKLESDLKTEFKNVDEREVIAFLVALDKLSLGVTSVPRKFLETLIGVKMSAFNTYESELEQLTNSLINAESLLLKMGYKVESKYVASILSKVSGK